MVGLIKNYVAFGSMAVPALTFAMMAVMPVAMAMPALVERDDHDVNRRVMPLQTILIEDATVSDTRNHRVLNGTNASDENKPEIEFIIGGTVIDEKNWDKSKRFLATLSFTQDNGKPFHICGATLISPRVALSAAHCFTSLDSMDFEAPTNIKFNLYSYDVPTEVVTIPICPNEGGEGDCSADFAFAIRHEEYNDVTLAHDFALIILPNTKQVHEGVIAKIHPVQLNSDPMVPVDGEMLEVFGWGSTRTGPVLNKPRVPSTVNLRYLPNGECQESLGDSRDITGSMLCAIGNGTTSAFKGDSGGPILTLSSKSSKSIQVGVTGVFDTDIDPTKSPNVFARVSDGFSWIQASVCREIPDDKVFCTRGGAKSSKKQSKSKLKSKTS